MTNCIFCDKKEIEKGLLDDTNNFYHRANMKGAIAPGHSMIISKKHFLCFGEMPKELDNEYMDFLRKVEKRTTSAFGEPIIVEQGIHGQSINHAHIHIFPRTSKWYDFSKEKSFMDFVPKEIPITKIEGIQDIRKIFQQESQYVTIQEAGNLYLCHTKYYKGSLRTRDFISKLTGLTHLLNWQTISNSEKRKNKGRIVQTIEKLKIN